MTPTDPPGPAGRSLLRKRVRGWRERRGSSNVLPLAQSPSTSSRSPRDDRLKRVVEKANARRSARPWRICPQIGYPRPMPSRSLRMASRPGIDRQLSQDQRVETEKMAVFAPIPSASERTATLETNGVASSIRDPYRTSWMKRSRDNQLQISRVFS